VIEHSVKTINEKWRAPETMRGFDKDDDVYGDYGPPSDVYGWAVTTASVGTYI
jgi:hypothetical protein